MVCKTRVPGETPGHEYNNVHNDLNSQRAYLKCSLCTNNATTCTKSRRNAYRRSGKSTGSRRIRTASLTRKKSGSSDVVLPHSQANRDRRPGNTDNPETNGNPGTRYGAPHYDRNMAAPDSQNLAQDQGTQVFHAEDLKRVQLPPQTDELAHGTTGPQHKETVN